MEVLLNGIAENLGWVLVALVFLAWAVGSTITTVVKTGARERTKREIAAYVAEGSMSPEVGERLIRAQEPEED